MQANASVNAFASEEFVPVEAVVFYAPRSKARSELTFATVHGVAIHGNDQRLKEGRPITIEAMKKVSQMFGEALKVKPTILREQVLFSSDDLLVWWTRPMRRLCFFDIDWQPAEERLRDKILVPVLDDQYGRVLDRDGIKLLRSGSSTFLVEAASQTFPVSPQTLQVILARAAEIARSKTLSFLAASFGRLPSPHFEDRRKVLALYNDKMVLNDMLARQCSEEQGVCDAIDRALEEINSNKDALDDLLNQQNYRLSYWKTAGQQLGYRRFFDVNSLVGLRQERERVFEETHALVLDWLSRGVLDGVRVDHPDGLRDPLEYLARLRQRAPEAWIVGEKILEPGEFLRESWPIQGTTGYDFMYMAGSVLLSPQGVEELTGVYQGFIGRDAAAALSDYGALVHDKKINVSQEALGSDVNRLTSLFVEICESYRDRRDYTQTEVRRAIRELAACLDIYRTYVVPDRGEITDEDRAHIAQAERLDQRVTIGERLFEQPAGVEKDHRDRWIDIRHDLEQRCGLGAEGGKQRQPVSADDLQSRGDDIRWRCVGQRMRQLFGRRKIARRRKKLPRRCVHRPALSEWRRCRRRCGAARRPSPVG